MSDDPSATSAPDAPPPPPGRKKDEIQIQAEDGSPVQPSQRKQARIELCRRQFAIGHGPPAVRSWLMRETPDKNWKVAANKATEYIKRALETLDSEVVAPRQTKQARARAMNTLIFQRAMALASDDSTSTNKAGYLNAALKAVDQISRIDGAYTFDGSTLIPTLVAPTSVDEALKIISHASATAEMAQRRGKMMAARPTPPPVIDAESHEVEDEPGDPGEPRDAN